MSRSMSSTAESIKSLGLPGRFEQVVAERVQSLRVACAAAGIGDFTFTIEASGRSEAGLMKIEYSMGRWGKEVNGGDVESVLVEWLRRHGWDRCNAPLMLEPPTGPAAAPGFVTHGEE